MVGGPAQDGRPAVTDPRFARALALHQQGHIAQAVALYGEILAAQPRHADCLHMLGVAELQRGEFGRAIERLDRAIAIAPGVPTYHFHRALALQDLGRPEAAVEAYQRAIALRPGDADAHSNLGSLQRTLGRHAQALASFDQAIALRPDHAGAHHNRANLLAQLGRHAEAIDALDQAIRFAPQRAESHCSRALSLCELGRHGEALASLDTALRLRPDHPQALLNRGNVLAELRRMDAAIECYSRAVQVEPGFAQARVNLGMALTVSGRHERAVECLDQAIRLRPDDAAAHLHRGDALVALGRMAEAIQSYERALALRPDTDDLPGMLLHTRMRCCDWSDHEAQVQSLCERVSRGERAAPPFAMLAICDSPALQRRAASSHLQTLATPRLGPAVTRPSTAGDRIRVAYYSADLHNHATAYLIAEVIERHDRSRFEVVAFSFGPERDDAMRRRLSAAFDRFIDVQAVDDAEVIRQSRQMGIDIAVDLKGLTRGCRPGIFLGRSAPIQVNFLGYPGSLGASCFDYIVGDSIVITPDSRPLFSEQVVRLPHCYQPNDGQRRVSERVFTRHELGLPEQAVVFCCFNQAFKITPHVFAIWMRILRKVERSVLWLFADNPLAVEHLRRCATSQGVDAARLVFARHLPPAEHLARHRAADLFLDTWPCNAHTTASDALWAGLPVLTRCGETFASRVAASLLHAVGLPELVTCSDADYEALAVDLALSPQRLRDLKDRLSNQRAEQPLFDAARFTHHLESAFDAMVRRQRAGLPPEDIDVER